jgi:hypothetical protein
LFVLILISQQLSGDGGMEDDHRNIEIIKQLIEKLDEYQIKLLIEYLHSVIDSDKAP